MRSLPVLTFAVAVLGIAVFSGMDAAMKRLVLANGVYPALLWRNVAGALLCLPLLLLGQARVPPRSVLRLHLVRGVITAGMALLFFWGLARMPMAQAVALAFVAPLIALVLARLLLGERIRAGAVWGSLAGLAGVLVILAGQAQGGAAARSLPGAGAVLLSAICYAFNIILMRRQSLVAGPIEVAFSQNLIVAVVLAMAAPFTRAGLTGRGELPFVLLAALLASAALLLLAWAYARGRASDLAPSEFTAFLWAALLGWLVFGEQVSRYTLAGAILIVAGCAIATRGAGPPLETES